MTDQASPHPESDQEESFPEFVTIVGVKIRDQGEVKPARTENSSLRAGGTVLLELDNDVT